MSLQNIPEELKAFPNWTGWMGEDRAPINLRTGGNAMSNNSATWSTFDVALKKCDELTGEFDGAGIAVPAGYVGFDFDGVVKDGVIEPFVQVILRLLGNPYCELSPSGNGLRAFVRHNGPKLAKTNFLDKTRGKYGIEIYAGSHTPKVLTVTGNHVSGQGVPVLDSLGHAYALCSRILNEPFKKLWMGDASAHNNDDSAADFALLRMLADLTNGNAALMETYFNTSVRGQREKWAREDYRATSIANALKTWSGKSFSPKTGTQQKTAPYTPLPFKFSQVEGGAYDCVIGMLEDAPENTSEGWFFRGDMHIVGGPSGVNKTTWMLALLEAQFKRERFLGHPTFGLPYLVLQADRGKKAHLRTCNRMGINPDTLPIKFLPSVWGNDAAHAILEKIEACNPLPAVVFIEGCDMLVENASKMEVVAPFVFAMQQIAERYHISLIGSTGSPKSRFGEGYQSGRDKIFGSTCWGRKTETMVIIDYFEGDDTDPRRNLAVYLRNGMAEKYHMKMEKGRLVVDTDATETTKSQTCPETIWFSQQTGWFTAEDAKTGLKKSQASAYRLIANARAKKHIVKKADQPSGEAALYQWNTGADNPENVGEMMGAEPYQMPMPDGDN